MKKIIALLSVLAMPFTVPSVGAEQKSYVDIAKDRLEQVRTRKDYTQYMTMSVKTLANMHVAGCPAPGQQSLTLWVALNDKVQSFDTIAMPRPDERRSWVGAFKIATKLQWDNSYLFDGVDAFMAIAPRAGIVIVGTLDKNDCFLTLESFTPKQWAIFEQAAAAIRGESL